VSRRSLGRTAGLISAATMLSRVLGLVREQLFAALLGATAMADAFVAAFRIPNLLRDLFAEGALSAAFVPAFKKQLRDHGQEGAYRLGNTVAGNLLVLVGLLVGLGIFFAPEILLLMAGAYDKVPGKFALAIELTRVMMPFLLLVTMAAVAMGMLNTQERFGPGALAPAMFNVVAIAVGFTLWGLGVDGPDVAVGWAVGTLIAGLAQLGIQLPPLWKLGWRPSLRFDLRLRDPAVRQVAMTMAPAIASTAALQVNVFINTSFASNEQGAVAWLNYAFRFMQLPLGVFGVAIATVSTTRFAEAAAEGDRPLIARHLVEGLRLVMFLCVPATVGLLVLGEPIIRLIYERGLFHSWDTDATTQALDLYVAGLVAYAAVKVLAPAFYAVNLNRFAVAASLAAVVANLALNVVLHPHYGYRVLALGTSVAMLVNCAVLYVAFHRRIAPLPHLALLAYLVRIGIAAAIMGGATWGTWYGLDRVLGHHGFGVRAVEAMVPVVVGAAVYALACALLRVEELEQLSAKLRRRLTR
jgi:putative peptidoglycan lipid II flippase